MRKPKVGEYIRMISYGHHYEFKGKIAKVVDNPNAIGNITLDFGKPIGREEKKTHNGRGFENPHYLYLTDIMQYEILVQDNALNRLLYPELKPDGEGYLI
jgi:hypothetical protein